MDNVAANTGSNLSINPPRRVTFSPYNQEHIVTPVSTMTPNTRLERYGESRYGDGVYGWQRFINKAGQGS